MSHALKAILQCSKASTSAAQVDRPQPLRHNRADVLQPGTIIGAITFHRWLARIPDRTTDPPLERLATSCGRIFIMSREDVGNDQLNGPYLPNAVE